MEFSGEFELEGVSPEVAWLVLTDPIAIEGAIPGCEYLRHVEDEDDFNFDEYEPDTDLPTLPEADREVVEERAFEEGETYATLTKVGIGDISPTFESVVTIEEREYLSMSASGRGATIGSAFSMTSNATVSETDDGAKVEWEFEVDVTGKIAQMNERVLDSVADKVVNQFFTNIQGEIRDVEHRMEDLDEEEVERRRGLVTRVRDFFARG